ncbi:hypothetical protein A0H81_06424 [Grifola frondosa]|uniref:Uncharacterized protein n=1 Tax=Grifola frondosa TaxID=5627 RepID=A0A1C7MBK2_GRIFR|nr:hypothetical protein A0H81_06424 [Grifola frondosa]
MNVAALLQDSPSDDHRRRQQARDRDHPNPPQHQQQQQQQPPPHHPQSQDRPRDRDRERPPSNHPHPTQQQLPPRRLQSPPLHRHPRPPSPPHHPYPPPTTTSILSVFHPRLHSCPNRTSSSINTVVQILSFFHCPTNWRYVPLGLRFPRPSHTPTMRTHSPAHLPLCTCLRRLDLFQVASLLLIPLLMDMAVSLSTQRRSGLEFTPDHHRPSYPSWKYACRTTATIRSPPEEKQHREWERERWRRGFELGTTSPVMASLQRPMPLFDERERERDNGPGPGMRPEDRPRALPGQEWACIRAQMQMLAGPGMNSSGLSVGVKERERERTGMGGGNDSPGGRRGRLGGKERERERQREKDKEREPDGISMADMEAEREREREYYRKAQIQAMNANLNSTPNPNPPQNQMREQAQGQAQMWTRFEPPRIGPGSNVEDERLLREREREIERMREDDMRAREAREPEWEMEKAEQLGRTASKGRQSAKEREREARDKDKEEWRMRPGPIEREREREEEMFDERERERALRSREAGNWPNMDRERERDRMQREDAEAMRVQRVAQGQAQAAPHHHHHHHHHHPSSSASSFAGGSSQGHAKTKGSAPPQSMPMPMTPIGPGMPPGDQPPFGQMMQEREQAGVAPFRQGSLKMTTGPGPGPPSLTQIVIPPQQQIQQQQHPHHHPYQPQQAHPPNPLLHQHPHSHPHLAGGPGPLGFRPAVHLLRPPHPQHHLGTFVYPRTPFPFLDFPSPSAETGAPAEPQDIRATILLPCGFLPTSRPARPRIWGGAPIPSVPPLTAAQQQMVQQFGAGQPGYGRPHAFEMRSARRVYTDDSDLFLCAMHAGMVTWSETRRARRARKDLKMEVRLTREARYVEGEEESEDDGSYLMSAGWGNSHDGAGIEILWAEFVEPKTAHSAGLRNRGQRLQEYSERRSALSCCSSLPRKRARLHGVFSADDAESAIYAEVERADDELSATRTMVFGSGANWPEIGFKYHPSALRGVLFPQPCLEPRPRKRRRLDSSRTGAPAGSAIEQIDASASTSVDEDLVEQRAIVVETLWESFLISQRSYSKSVEGDKENLANGVSGSRPKERRYVVALISTAGGIAGKPPKAKRPFKEQSSNDTSILTQTVSAPREALQPSQDAHIEDATQQGVSKPLDIRIEEPAPSEASTDNEPITICKFPSELPQPELNLSKAFLLSIMPAPLEAIMDVDKPPTLPTPANEDKTAKTSAPSSDPSPTEPAEVEALPPPPSTPPQVNGVDADDSAGPIQILHRDLGEENFEFLEDGINILSSEVENGMRKGWSIEARQWKWVQVGIAS